MIATHRGKRSHTKFMVAALLALVLLWPAILNGLPLFFPDSGAYLYVAWGNHWLLDRSSFYGALIKPLMVRTDLAGLWLALVPQVLATLLLLQATARKLDVTGWVMAAGLVLAVSTGPWHASQLMPDAYAAAIILIGWLCASRAPSESGSPSLWLLAGALCLMHSTYPALLIASVVACLAMLWFGGLAFRAIAGRLLALVIAVLFTVSIQLLANAAFIHQATYAPKSSAFLYASLNEDGIIDPWLQANCTYDPRVKELCAIAPNFPQDSQQLLWGKSSPYWGTVWNQRAGDGGVDWEKQLGIAARGALLHSPTNFALAAMDATTEQFFSYRVLDDECPDVCLRPSAALQGALRENRPQLIERVNAAPQVRGEFRAYPLLAVTGSVSTLGLLGLVVLLPLAMRRRDSTAASLLAAILASLLANAFVTGTFSDVHDRYQSRVIWIAPVACVLILLRWRAQRRGMAEAA